MPAPPKGGPWFWPLPVQPMLVRPLRRTGEDARASIDFPLYRLPALSIFYLAGFYFIWTFAWRGKSREDDPTEMVYSPGTSCHAFLASSKMERNSGSIWTVTSLLSPAASLTLRQPIRRLGGSPALAGRAA